MTAITISRGTAGLVAQALDQQAHDVRKRSRTRSYGGPRLAEVRAKMRAKANILEVEANLIREQLRHKEQ